MKIKKGDNVIVVAGKDKGKKGKVVETFPKDSRVIIEGVSVLKRHTKNRKTGKGQVIDKAMPIHVSNVMIEEEGKPVRIGYGMKGDKKIRISRKSGKEI